MGGTFDHFHEGHELLIKTALNISNNIVIGLTSSNLLKKKKFASKLEDYKTRKIHIEQFVNSFTDLKRIKIVELNDPYGPPINEPNYEGIVVSQETYQNALKINEIRKDKGFKPMIIVVIPILKDENDQKISSTSIREKLI